MSEKCRLLMTGILGPDWGAVGMVSNLRGWTKYESEKAAVVSIFVFKCLSTLFYFYSPLCEECAEHVPVNSWLGHLVSYHVEEPCLRDMSMVEAGDSRSLSCSQHSGVKACYIDAKKTRINNGIFNYLGKEDPVACLL